MNEWTCDECKYKDVPITTFPCCDCLDGDRFEPEEGTVKTMNEWTCYVCKYECAPIYANPCCKCVDGDLFEPAEAMFRENVRRNQRKEGENHDD